MPTLFCALGGVVFADQSDRAIEAWRVANGGHLGVNDVHDLDDAQFHGFQAGLVGESEYGRHLRARLGWTGSDEDLVTIWSSGHGPVVLDVIEVLSALRERGWQLVATTNVDPWRERARADEFGWVLSLFDRVVTSTQARARKPDPRFFAEMLRGVGHHGPKIVVDARPENVSAARRAGVDGYVYGTPNGLLGACRSLVLASS